MESSSESDFRGILAQELSDLQRRLTERTSNVTTILDCCHSGTMSRDPSVVPEGRVPRLLDRGRAVLAGASSRPGNGPRRRRSTTSNQLAVRVVACDPSQSAYERTGADGRRHGALTEQLAAALDELGERPVSWSVIGERIRRSIATTLPMQRPGDRRTGGSGALLPPLAHVDEGAARDGAAAAPPRSTRPGCSASRRATRTSLVAEDETKIGAATVARRRGRSSRARGDREARSRRRSSAVPTRTHDAQPVRLDVAGGVAELVVEARAGSSSLRQAVDEPPIVTIAGDDGLVVLDAAGLAVNAQPYSLDATGVGKAIEVAERIAKATRLRNMTSTLAQGAGLTGAVTVELATHRRSARRIRGNVGERLYVGDRVSVTITNRDAIERCSSPSSTSRRATR